MKDNEIQPIAPLHVVLSLVLVICCTSAKQVEAAIDHDMQLWFPLYNRLSLPGNFRGWLEANPRYGNNASEIDQFLLRPAIGYQITPSLSLWQGYAWVTNYEPRFRDEHRLYQQLSYRHRFSRFKISSRTRFEERFIRNAVGTALRAREMVRGDIPFGQDERWALVIYDEMFMNLNTIRNGPKSGFDQNRFFVGINHKLTKTVAVDFGYQNQTINRKGANTMNHIILIQWFLDWGKK